MPGTTIQKLSEFGQSIWLDNINRSLIESGKLNQLIDYGLRGMTSNPTIFEKAISKSNEYDLKIAELSKKGKSVFEIYDDLTVRDIQEAADIFKRVYDQTAGLDGYVSLEVNPLLAQDAGKTIGEAKRLFKKVNRANVMFKIPATAAGFEAVEELLSEGININVTLIFFAEQYINTAQAFLRGLKRLSKKTGDLSKVSSVASVFVSRVDSIADKMIDELIAKEQNNTVKNRLLSLKGEAAVANSKIIYQEFRKVFLDDTFEKMRKQNARLQRVLWASTSTKNPVYSDIKYVSELMAKDTVNTLPDETLYAFLDHGEVKEGLDKKPQEAVCVAENLKQFGVDINDICRKLLNDGVIAFEKSFDSLLKAIEEKKKAAK